MFHVYDRLGQIAAFKDIETLQMWLDRACRIYQLWPSDFTVEYVENSQYQTYWVDSTYKA